MVRPGIAFVQFDGDAKLVIAQCYEPQDRLIILSFALHYVDKRIYYESKYSNVRHMIDLRYAA